MNTPEELIGQHIAGKYRVARVIGTGGMGVVYEASHEWTGRRVAVKVLKRDVSEDDEIAQRFLREAKTAAALHHPNVVDVLDMGREDDGLTYLVLELLQGESLRETIHREKRLVPGVAKNVLEPIMMALAEAHDRGIVHRDLKPENIFICRDPRDGGFVPKLLDFGIAKLSDQRETLSLTKTGAIIGTPQYMSPEQVDGQGHVTPAADVWSMGIVIYQCLSGLEPYGADSVASVLVAILTGDPPDLRSSAPDLPPALGSVVEWALQRDPEQRPRMRALAEAFRAAVDEGVDVLGAGRVDATTARESDRPPPRGPIEAVRRPGALLPEDDGEVPVLPVSPLGRAPVLGAAAAVALALFGGGIWLGMRDADDPEPEPTKGAAVLPVAPTGDVGAPPGPGTEPEPEPDAGVDGREPPPEAASSSGRPSRPSRRPPPRDPPPVADDGSRATVERTEGSGTPTDGDPPSETSGARQPANDSTILPAE